MGSGQSRGRGALVVAAAMCVGCYTGIDGNGPGGDPDAGPDWAASGSADDGGSGPDREPGELDKCDPAGKARVWRLTAKQYDRTVASVFAFDPDATWSDGFAADPQSHFFSNNSDVLLVPPQLTLELSRTAERIVGEVFEDAPAHLSHLWSCDVAELENDEPAAGCIESFLANAGKLVYRRPLDGPEIGDYVEMVEAASTGQRGIQLALEAMLQSPHFLYRSELGGSTLTPHEAVSFLAFTVWNQGPDLELLELADAGFETESAVGRVLDDPRGDGFFSRFFLDWMDLDETHLLAKPNDPRSSQELSAAMQQEVSDYVERIMLEGGGTQEEIFASAVTVHNPTLDGIYGEVEVGDDDLVEHPPQERAGILTLPAWLATYAEPDHPTPIARGVFIRTRIMCQEMPPIPPGVNPEVPPPAPGETTRERFDRHTSDPVCASCHELIDPLGFLFSNYDPLGAFITEEAGQPVDSTGKMVNSLGFDGNYDNAVDMLKRLATSPDLTQCLPQQMYKFVYGQTFEAREDECGLDKLTADYRASDGDIRHALESMLVLRLEEGADQ